MQANTVKNRLIRKRFNKIEIESRIKKFIFTNFLNHVSLKKIKSFRYLLSNNFISKQGSKSLIKNKCVLTGRNRSVNKKYNVSRLQLRNLLSFGIIPGYKKAVW